MTAVGYARVSIREQNPALQRDALTAADCVRVFTDVASGVKTERPHLAAALDYLRPGDVLVVWQLDRLGRNMRHLIDTVNGLHDRGVQFPRLRENVDTTTAFGKLTFHLFAALAELRTRAAAGMHGRRADRDRRPPGPRPQRRPAPEDDPGEDHGGPADVRRPHPRGEPRQHSPAPRPVGRMTIMAVGAQAREERYWPGELHPAGTGAHGRRFLRRRRYRRTTAPAARPSPIRAVQNRSTMVSSGSSGHRASLRLWIVSHMGGFLPGRRPDGIHRRGGGCLAGPAADCSDAGPLVNPIFGGRIRECGHA